MTRQEFENNISKLLKDKNYKQVISIYKKSSRGNLQAYVENVFFLLVQPLCEAECGSEVTVSDINNWLDEAFDGEWTRRNVLTAALIAKL